MNFRFDDPFLPYVLREVIHDPEHHRLLRLVEAGIPAWAIVLPKFSGLYHRSMRHFLAAAVVIMSCLSMLLGFYDLYKRIPLVRSLLKQTLGPLSSKLEELVVAPRRAVSGPKWLEHHGKPWKTIENHTSSCGFQVRLSFLLTWILPYNTILRRTWHGLQMLWDCVKSLGASATSPKSQGISKISFGFHGSSSAFH